MLIGIFQIKVRMYYFQLKSIDLFRIQDIAEVIS